VIGPREARERAPEGIRPRDFPADHVLRSPRAEARSSRHRAMYHDQGLIPRRWTGSAAPAPRRWVCTFIRTSVESRETAFDQRLEGRRSQARPRPGLVKAARVASEMARRRAGGSSGAVEWP